jgi:hypothetical protein
VPQVAERGAEGAEPDLMRVCVREKLEHLRLYPQQKTQSSATKQGNNMVEVFFNMCLISKVNNIEYEEQMVAWDNGEEELEEE